MIFHIHLVQAVTSEFLKASVSMILVATCWGLFPRLKGVVLTGDSFSFWCLSVFQEVPNNVPTERNLQDNLFLYLPLPCCPQRISYLYGIACPGVLTHAPGAIKRELKCAS